MKKEPLKDRLKFSYEKFRDKLFHYKDRAEESIGKSGLKDKAQKYTTKARRVINENGGGVKETITNAYHASMDKIEEHTRSMRDLLKKFLDRDELNKKREKFSDAAKGLTKSQLVKNVTSKAALRYAALGGLGLGGYALYKKHQRKRAEEGEPEPTQRSKTFRRVALGAAGVGAYGLAKTVMPHTTDLATDKLGQLLRGGIKSGLKLPFKAMKYGPLRGILGSLLFGMAFPQVATATAMGGLAGGAYRLYKKRPKFRKDENLGSSFKEELNKFRDKMRKKTAAEHTREGEEETLREKFKAGLSGFDVKSKLKDFASFGSAMKHKLGFGASGETEKSGGSGGNWWDSLIPGIGEAFEVGGLTGLLGLGKKHLGKLKGLFGFGKQAASEATAAENIGAAASKVSKLGGISKAIKPLASAFNVGVGALGLVKPNWVGSQLGNDYIGGFAGRATDTALDFNPATIAPEVVNRALGRSPNVHSANTSYVMKGLDYLQDHALEITTGIPDAKFKNLVKEQQAKNPNKAGYFMAGKKPPVDMSAVIKQLEGLGWSKEQAQGIAANIIRESSGNKMASGDSGTAIGLAQWHPDRQAMFKKVMGKDIHDSTTEDQVKFIDWELRHSEKAAGNALAKTTTAEDAAAVIAKKYERPKDKEGEAAIRAGIASQLSSAVPEAPKVGPYLSGSSNEVRVADNKAAAPVIIAPQTTNVSSGKKQETPPADSPIAPVRNDESSYKRAQDQLNRSAVQ